ncbi:MAG: diphthamide synthesis protein [Nanoarchaeota archaeon]|nr:diphthamide synthesis protein [Nanoarchaeota archaeon]
METLFVEARYAGSIDISKIKDKKLPSKLGLATTVQFLDYLDKIKGYLEKKGKIIFLEKGKHLYLGQVLGCSQSSVKELSRKVDAYLYIGDGRFHPIGIALKTHKPVFTFNPLSNEFKKIEKGDIERIKMKRKAQMMKFYSSKEIGVIISTKPRQNKFKEAIELKKRFPDKNFYFILFDTIDYPQLENFNFIESWINTACPRIEEDIKVINIEHIR